ncbi:MAG: tRNA (guanosine(46)-N7)-methyltransferase TrmB [Candidatus Latescibacteria bacterium]|nr:tRNA (guanosine(46)-N7)-methyltransferase TrmB [Candidatus Latescibacterota bacterium]
MGRTFAARGVRIEERRIDRTFAGAIADLFPTRQPLEIEIGSGKGRFLLHRAQAHRDRNFFGIDYRWRFLKEGVLRAEQRGLTNLIFLKTEAEEIIPHLVPPASVEVFHIYFPDPWHKKKHHKRRLLTPEFFKLLHASLVPGGLLELATDNFDYMIAFKAALVEAGDTLWSGMRETRNERILDPGVQTHFEAKYARAGRDLYYIELCK